MRRPRPSLSEDASPEAFADAMRMCRGYAPSCSDMHECAQGGACFIGDNGPGLKRAIEMVQVAEENSDRSTRAWLRAAREFLTYFQEPEDVECGEDF